MTPKVALVICSVGRPGIVAELVPWLTRQTTKPSEIVFVVTRRDDLPDDAVLEPLGARIVYSEKGLPRQRNRGLDSVLAQCDAVFFIDDDYLPAPDAFAGIARAMAAFPKAAGFTGRLLADGIHTGGVTLDEAGDLLADYEAAGGAPLQPAALARNLVGLYGCNMVYRCAAIGNTRFDEALPLYGWQEDVDFAARLPGEKIRTDAFAGVHCGTSSGRETSGFMLGYSQVANPVYLMRKGSLPRRFALSLMLRNVLANHLKTLRPEAWIDRHGRACGNRRAFFEVLSGKASPGRILEFRR